MSEQNDHIVIEIKEAAEIFRTRQNFWYRAAATNRYQTPEGKPVWWKVGDTWKAYRDEVEEALRRLGGDEEAKD